VGINLGMNALCGGWQWAHLVDWFKETPRTYTVAIAWRGL